ncbi:hypothetical protein SEA_SAFTANT_54 [Streptomyces phage Saftant]|uniref:Uncharacterized protein n=1 Tax=Streptomyces phage Saftant TaxID=2601693 RepID=A0A5J6D981_9CAUD|nr:hypothetical protein KGG95_gp54 [Streptomyces phage Saftant]QEQ94086.1 hypothetical protein SEA_SAFTANT_54 [Streptomyces phage Saftant]
MRYTDLDGNARESVVSFDRTCRDEFMAEMTNRGMTDVEPFLYDPLNDKEIPQ